MRRFARERLWRCAPGYEPSHKGREDGRGCGESSGMNYDLHTDKNLLFFNKRRFPFLILEITFYAFKSIFFWEGIRSFTGC